MSRCSCQWRRRSSAPVASSCSRLILPPQYPSVARFNSRAAPREGKPKFEAIVIGKGILPDSRLLRYLARPIAVIDAYGWGGGGGCGGWVGWIGGGPCRACAAAARASPAAACAGVTPLATSDCTCAG